MDQGFGVRARNLRKTLLAQFVTTYKLKTLKQGAIVRTWPKGYTVWNEDSTKEEGYSLLQCYTKEPTREIIGELFEVVANPNSSMTSGGGGGKNIEPNPVEAIVGEITAFFKGMSKL